MVVVGVGGGQVGNVVGNEHFGDEIVRAPSLRDEGGRRGPSCRQVGGHLVGAICQEVVTGDEAG
jgi:hypothetical protein